MRETEIKIAIAHDYLTQRGGAERVVLSLLKAFPDAPLYTTLYEPTGTYSEFSSVEIHTSFLDRRPIFRRDHRLALPFLPFAAQSIHIDADLVIASSSGWAHGFRTSGKKIVYCHTPARWLYERDHYLGESAGLLERAGSASVGPLLRCWDRRAAATADLYLANAHVAQDRIRRVYGVDAEIVYPPHSMSESATKVSVKTPSSWGPDPSFDLTVSRLLPYKNVDQVIRACHLAGRNLVIVGRGPERARLASIASDRVLFIEGIDDAELRWLYGRATALIAASHEDLGLTPIEASRFGTPTVALRAGGYLDTVEEGVNGLFFSRPTAHDIAGALRAADDVDWSCERMRSSTAKFSEQAFIAAIRGHAEALMTTLRSAKS